MRKCENENYKIVNCHPERAERVEGKFDIPPLPFACLRQANEICFMLSDARGQRPWAKRFSIKQCDFLVKFAIHFPQTV